MNNYVKLLNNFEELGLLNIKANIDNRICFHTADATNSKLILDKTGAEGLKVKGRCLISSAGDIQEGQTFFIQDCDVQNAIKSHLNKPRRAIEEKLINNSSKNKKGSFPFYFNFLFFFIFYRLFHFHFFLVLSHFYFLEHLELLLYLELS